MSQPMTDERLAEIRANAMNLWVPGDWNDAANDVSELLAEVERLKARLAFEAEAYEAVNAHKNSLLRSGRMLVALAKEVAKDYEDAADWKDDRGRLQSMAQDALHEVGAAQ